MRHSWRPRDVRNKKIEKVTYIGGWGRGGNVNSCHILEKMLLYINVYEFLERRIHVFLPKLSDRCFQLVSVRLRSPCWCSNTKLYKFDHEYSRSSPCDHSRKRPALVTTTFVKPCLNCDLNFVMKTSRKRPRPLLRLPNWTFPLFLSCRKQPLKSLIIINNHFNDSVMKLHTVLMV